MSIANKSRLKLPDRMKTKLESFQRQVWMVKLAEGVLAALFGLVVSYLLVFALDRVMDTPAWGRGLILILGTLGAVVWLPMMIHKWIWRSRRLEQVARLLRYRFPRLSDHLLGIIELVNNEHETGHSEALCRAALEQVDERTAEQDFTGAVPVPKHRRWGLIAGVATAVAAAAMIIVPAAGGNAVWRWLMPWGDTPRYTFAQMNELPSELVVPVGERSGMSASLSDATRWTPETASVNISGMDRIEAPVSDGGYAFDLPPLKEDSVARVAVGDFVHEMVVQPKTRPELSQLLAEIKLPEYLQRSENQTRDLRGGAISLVKGAQVTFNATATRDLQYASFTGGELTVRGDSVSTPVLDVLESQGYELEWTDSFGLSARNPLSLNIKAIEDQQPSLFCRNMNNKRVIMVKDTLTFEFTGEDDFGIQTIGLEYSGIKTEENPEPVRGEKIVSAGNPEATSLEGVATFSPERLGIEPQVIRLKLYATDYLPDRDRIYSPTYMLFVLSQEEHAIWLTRQLDQWFKVALESYDKEQELFARNRMLRDLPADELDKETTRRQIKTQAAEEKAQSRRLTKLTEIGEGILKEAARNDEFNVATLEQAAAMMQKLGDIAENRMPSVEDLLGQAADAKAGSSGSSQSPSGEQSEEPNPGESNPSDSDSENNADSENEPKDGSESAPNENESRPKEGSGEGESSDSPPGINIDRSETGGDGGESGESEEEEGEKPEVPSISDIESSMMTDQEEKEEAEGEQPPGGSPKFGLPSTTLMGGPTPPPGECPAGDQMDQAVEEQQELLAEFAEVAEEMRKILTNLEGSTFVKRLKAMSRRQLDLANDVNRFTLDDFGSLTNDVNESVKRQFELLAERQEDDSRTVGYILEDLDAFVERTRAGKYQTVLDEMKNDSVVQQFGEISEEITTNKTGSSIAHAEIMADTLDRWAEQLVGPG